MSQLKWTGKLPVEQGWYWVKWRSAEKITMWFFDGSDWDIHELKTKGVLFYGPLQPPEDTK